MYVPVEQMPLIELWHKGADRWLVQINIILPNGGPDEKRYHIAVHCVSAKSLLRAAAEFRCYARILRTRRTVPEPAGAGKAAERRA